MDKLPIEVEETLREIKEFAAEVKQRLESGEFTEEEIQRRVDKRINEHLKIETAFEDFQDTSCESEW